MESTMNEYIRQMDCELMQIGGLLDAKGKSLFYVGYIEKHDH